MYSYDRRASAMITVYHATTPEAAKLIVKTKLLKPKAEPDVYVSSMPHTDHYGSTVVEMQVPEHLLELDDEFPNGRLDYRIHTGYKGSVRIYKPRIIMGG